MKYDTSATPGIHKVTMGRRSTDREDPHRRSLSCVRRNRCAVFPANASMVAQSLERRNDCWYTPCLSAIVGLLSFAIIVVSICKIHAGS